MAVFAEVEHRHWLRAVDAFLAGPCNGAAPPPHDCRFVQWWEEQGGHAARPDLRRAKILHGQLHALGRELVERHLRGDAVAAGPARLAGLCEEFIAALQARDPAGAPAPTADDMPGVV